MKPFLPCMLIPVLAAGALAAGDRAQRASAAPDDKPNILFILVLDKQGVRPKLPYAERGVRDKRYKLWVQPGEKANRLYDLATDPAETTNLIDSREEAHVAALEKLQAVVASFPDQDARPRYEPLPRRPGDRKTPR